MSNVLIYLLGFLYFKRLTSYIHTIIFLFLNIWTFHFKINIDRFNLYSLTVKTQRENGLSVDKQFKTLPCLFPLEATGHIRCTF